MSVNYEFAIDLRTWPI